MSLHIGAQPNHIAETVLISGDPLRAKYVADQMLTDVFCYNQVRGMLGFTGYYKGKRVSVQGTGMGIPSTAIYVQKLIREYGVKKLIRIGTCGALQPELELGQLIVAHTAFTDSSTHLKFYNDFDTAAPASTVFVELAQATARKEGINVQTGPVFSTDLFYNDEENYLPPWIAKGVLGIEMESSILFALAEKNKVEALSILTVSDNLITKKFTSPAEREKASLEMMTLALEIA